jgi:hypothetical protein
VKELTEIEKAAMRLQSDFQVKIAERAERDIKGWKKRVTRMSFIMDLCSVPDLDLPALLAAPAFDFAHDVCGIVRHMDRGHYPGTLTDCFVPRFSRGGEK